MGVGLLLRAQRPKSGLFGRPSAETWLAEAAKWSKAACRDTLIDVQIGRDSQDRPAIALALHPLAETVDIAVLPDGRVEVSAKTSTAGPGYHVYACDVLDRLSRDLHLTWEPPESDESIGDETGYFLRRDYAAVEREMLAWLKGVAGVILQRIDESGGLDLAIGRSLDEPEYQHDGLVWTALGPRDRSWLERAALDPIHAIDLFPWWQRGFGAPYYLGRALSLMWAEMRWRAPITDEEKKLLATVLTLLERAHEANPQMELPWAEWNELNGFAGRSDALAEDISRRVQQQGLRPAIGYRRRPVRVTVSGGWSIEVPGSYAAQKHADGSWQGFDERIAVYLSSLTMIGKSPDAPPPPAEELLQILPAGPDVLEHRDGALLARSRFTDDGNLQGMTAVAGTIALSTITMSSPDDRDVAIRIWRSIRAPADKAESLRSG